MLDLEWLKFPRRLFLAPTLNIRHRRSLQKYRKLINISGVCFLRFSAVIFFTCFYIFDSVSGVIKFKEEYSVAKVLYWNRLCDRLHEDQRPKHLLCRQAAYMDSQQARNVPVLMAGVGIGLSAFTSGMISLTHL